VKQYLVFGVSRRTVTLPPAFSISTDDDDDDDDVDLLMSSDSRQ